MQCAFWVSRKKRCFSLYLSFSIFILKYYGANIALAKTLDIFFKEEILNQTKLFLIIYYFSLISCTKEAVVSLYIHTLIFHRILSNKEISKWKKSFKSATQLLFFALFLSSYYAIDGVILNYQKAWFIQAGSSRIGSAFVPEAQGWQVIISGSFPCKNKQKWEKSGGTCSECGRTVL